MLKRLFVVLLLLATCLAQGLREQLASVVSQRYAKRMPYATIVAYKSYHFAALANRDSDTRNSTGGKTHFAIYEHLPGKGWRFVFEFDAGVDADEESSRLDRLFMQHQLSAQMRGRLMYGEEQSLF